MSDGIGLAEAMLGLDGFRVLEVSETPDEVIITVETTAMMVGCAGCGVRVEAQDRASIAGLSPHLDHATRIADPFHVVRVGNRCLDRVRRRVLARAASG